MIAPISTVHASASSNVRSSFRRAFYNAIRADSAQYDQSLRSAALELKYERSAHLVDIISKDEGIRKIRFDLHVLEDDNEELRDLLAQEEDRSDSLEKLINKHLARAEDAEAQLHRLDDELQAKHQELSTLRAEAQALRNTTTDSTKLLTEKLELTRQLSTLKPELDHLRSQATATQQTLADKLALQRQLSELHVELEHARTEAKRAMAKRRNTQHDLAQEDTIDDLRKALTREKRLREKAEEAAETAQADLEREKKSLQRRSAKEAKKAEHDAQVDVETEQLRRDLAQQQKEHERAAKTFAKSQSDWEAAKSILDDKLNQFRTKLKSTKERLKEAESQLLDAHTAAAVGPKQPVKSSTATKPSSKRSAAQMDPDSQKLGTPGNDKPVKRGRKAAVSGVGDKSTFSITPFLNRTLSIGGAPDSPVSEPEAEAQAPESDVEASPTTAAAPVSRKEKAAPLREVPASKSNIKKASQPRKPKAALEKVVEEPEPASQQAKTTTSKVPLKSGADDEDNAPAPTKQKQKPKIRKSLATFAAFNLEPEPEKKQKKRKLGGLGKTLFDEEDEVATKPLPGGRTAGLFATTRLGPLAGIKGSFLGGGGKGLLGAGKKGGAGMMETGDGFMFSPLKRDRKVGASFLK
ncbi:hypothetical protein MBLNU459_g2739t1 [Dothideomycetes sp. NU459]